MNVRECQECGRWGETQSHHKIPRGRDKRGWDFPGNLIDLCWECHHGLQGPHKCRKRAGQYFLEVKAYLEETLAKDYYTPETLSRVIRLPIKQAYQVVKLIRPEEGGYPKEDIIFRLLGNRFALGGEDW